MHQEEIRSSNSLTPCFVAVCVVELRLLPEFLYLTACEEQWNREELRQYRAIKPQSRLFYIKVVFLYSSHGT